MRKRGRPRKAEPDKREERLDLRVTTAEKEAFKLAAAGENQDLSVWIRIQLHRAAGETLTEAPPVEDAPNGVENAAEYDKANADRAGGL